MQKSLKHFYWLDLFRFIAALIVVVGHTRGTTFVEYGALAENEKTLLVTAVYAITRIGNEAVIMFFVLSGFLVGGRALERVILRTFRPADYAIDRFVRIMLPLVPALGFTAIVRVIIDGGFSFSELIGNLFSLQGIYVPSFGGNAPLWSLSYEVWFYILAYAIGVTSIKRGLHLESAGLFILVAAVFTSLNSVYLFCWLIGAYAYFCMPQKFSWKMFAISLLICFYSICSIEIGSDSVSVSVEFIRNYLPSISSSRILLSAGMAMVIQQALQVKPHNAFFVKLDATGTVLAASSYTLYLSHFPVLQLMSYFGLKRAKHITYTSVGLFIFTITSCLVVSWVLYSLFEKHTDLLRKALKTRLL